MFRYTCLPFGISCAPESFQSGMEQLLNGIRKARNFQDGIIVWGNDGEEHDSMLAEVMGVLKNRNVLLNHEKCKFKITNTVFLGHQLSTNGVAPADDKILAVKKFRTPTTQEELRSFLGLVGYVGRFIPKLSEKTHALRELVKSSKYVWNEEHQKALDIIRKDVMSAPVLSYLSNERPTRIVADASSVGLGAVLLQFENPDKTNPVVISYANKALSETEKMYGQTEKEALAIVWAIDRFKFYLLGQEFEVETDHRPLENIFKPSSTPPGRIAKWILRL